MKTQITKEEWNEADGEDIVQFELLELGVSIFTNHNQLVGKGEKMSSDAKTDLEKKEWNLELLHNHVFMTHRTLHFQFFTSTY